MNHKHIFVASVLGFVALAAISLLPMHALAFGLPFGGRITTTKVPPNVQCATSVVSPFMITPVNSATVGPYSSGPGMVNVGQITPGAHILGLITGASSCVQVNGPVSNPYPTTFTNFYGTSMSF